MEWWTFKSSPGQAIRAPGVLLLFGCPAKVTPENRTLTVGTKERPMGTIRSYQITDFGGNVSEVTEDIPEPKGIVGRAVLTD